MIATRRGSYNSMVRMIGETQRRGLQRQDKKNKKKRERKKKKPPARACTKKIKARRASPCGRNPRACCAQRLYRFLPCHCFRYRLEVNFARKPVEGTGKYATPPRFLVPGTLACRAKKTEQTTAAGHTSRRPCRATLEVAVLNFIANDSLSLSLAPKADTRRQLAGGLVLEIEVAASLLSCMRK